MTCFFSQHVFRAIIRQRISDAITVVDPTFGGPLMHKLAVGFFYACATLAFAVTATVFIGMASEQNARYQYATVVVR
jgi:hypothetical protein